MATKDWKLIRNNPSYEKTWLNKKTDEEITVRFKVGKDSYVFILGNGRYQPEYLAGGNSIRHDATKSQAMALAREYMENN